MSERGLDGRADEFRELDAALAGRRPWIVRARCRCGNVRAEVFETAAGPLAVIRNDPTIIHIPGRSWQDEVRLAEGAGIKLDPSRPDRSAGLEEYLGLCPLSRVFALAFCRPCGPVRVLGAELNSAVRAALRPGGRRQTIGVHVHED